MAHKIDGVNKRAPAYMGELAQKLKQKAGDAPGVASPKTEEMHRDTIETGCCSSLDGILPACILDIFASIGRCFNSFFQWITGVFSSTKNGELPPGPDEILDEQPGTGAPDDAPDMETGPRTPYVQGPRTPANPTQTDATSPTSKRVVLMPIAPANLGKLQKQIDAVVMGKDQIFDKFEFPCNVLLRVNFAPPRGSVQPAIQHLFTSAYTSESQYVRYQSEVRKFMTNFSGLLGTQKILEDSNVTLLFLRVTKKGDGKYNVVSLLHQSTKTSSFEDIRKDRSSQKNVSADAVRDLCNSLNFADNIEIPYDKLLS